MASATNKPIITYVPYQSETQLPGIISLIEKDLSEPYSVYTYRYFINNWPELTILAMVDDPEASASTDVPKNSDPQNNNNNNNNNDDNDQTLSQSKKKCIGCIVGKLEHHTKTSTYRGYIAMLAVDKQYRKMGIGSKLVTECVQVMHRDGCDEVALETEEHNHGAMSLYENLGFIKDKRFFRYYLNGSDAFRLKLYLKVDEQQTETK